MTTKVQYNGKLYDGQECVWLQGINTVVICGDKLYYHPDILHQQEFKVAAIPVMDDLYDPVKWLAKSEPGEDITRQITQVKLEARLWNHAPS